jgi:hypothetical protein
MSDKPERPRFSDTQLAIAGLGAGIIALIVIIFVSLVL